MLGVRDHFHVAGVEGERQGARERRARARELSLRVPHRGRADERSRFGSRRKGRQVQDLFVPPEAFGRMPADDPEEHQPPRDVGTLRRDGRAR